MLSCRQIVTKVSIKWVIYEAYKQAHAWVTRNSSVVAPGKESALGSPSDLG